jgi:hypothetical protein
MLNAVLKSSVLLVSLSALAFPQAITADETNTSCIENLQVPFYPPLARLARLFGTFTVSVVLGPDSAVQTISSESMISQTARAIFVPAVAKAIRASSFVHSCGGKTVKLVFYFVLGDGAPSDHGQDVSFGYPNRFWISAPPAVLNP